MVMDALGGLSRRCRRFSQSYLAKSTFYSNASAKTGLEIPFRKNGFSYRPEKWIAVRETDIIIFG